MSSIRFHSREEGVADLYGNLMGSERYFMGSMISDLFFELICKDEVYDKENYGSFLDLIPRTSYLWESLRPAYDLPDFKFWRELRSWLKGSRSPVFIIGDIEIPVFEVELNTFYVLGNDVLKLMARLHGQCESHCYVEPPNRAWLSSVVKKGLKSSLFRKNRGWEDVIKLLESGNDSPVVCSYSVTQSFPNPYIAGLIPDSDCFDEEAELEDWINLSQNEKWSCSMSGLRSTYGLELTPDGWDDFHFGHGWDVFKLNDLLNYPKREWEEIAKKHNKSD